MGILIIVHGMVQGVGYRKFVKRKANHIGIKGFVRNVSDGSVEIGVSGKGDVIDSFVESINVSIDHGPEVYKIERKNNFLFGEEFDSFIIKPTRMI